MEDKITNLLVKLLSRRKGVQKIAAGPYLGYRLQTKYQRIYSDVDCSCVLLIHPTYRPHK